jgi:hypothetical protein
LNATKGKIMTVFFAVFIATFLLSSRLEAKEPAPGVRCDLVKESSIRDLPGFCDGRDYDRRRLVDFGSQLESLEACGERPLAKRIATALYAKTVQKDADTCADIALKITLKN